MARLTLPARAHIILSEKPTDPHRMDELTGDLSAEELESLAQLIGLAHLVPQSRSIIPRILPRALAVAQAAVQRQPVDQDDDVDDLIRNLDLATLQDDIPAIRSPATPPPSSPDLPATPPRKSTGSKSAPSTPARALPLYHFTSPSTEEGYTDDWLQAGQASQGRPGGAAQALVKSPKAKKATPSAYVVFFGRKVGVYTRCRLRGSGTPINAVSVAAAEKALVYARAQGWTGDSATPQPALPVPSSYAPNPLNSPNSSGPERWYAVSNGVHPGLYSSGLECHLNVSGFKNALHNSYTTRWEAEKALAAVAP